MDNARLHDGRVGDALKEFPPACGVRAGTTSRLQLAAREGAQLEVGLAEDHEEVAGAGAPAAPGLTVIVRPSRALLQIADLPLHDGVDQRALEHVGPG